MAHGKFVAYYRVSTQQQGRSGLGLEAQRATVEAYLDGGHWKLLGEFTEVETGKGSNALALVRHTGGETRRASALLLRADQVIE